MLALASSKNRRAHSLRPHEAGFTGEVKREDSSYNQKVQSRVLLPPELVTLTPVFSAGESRGQRSLVGYSPWSLAVKHDQVTNTFILK